MKCFMCKSRRVKPLTARRDGNVYTNAQSVRMFCSLRCAANHSLLWGSREILEGWHWCSATQSWEAEPADVCRSCQQPTILAPSSRPDAPDDPTID